ncbi:MAG: hypothetical protein ACYTEQ_28015 [Planctomycetota bacterium]|jgi:hypothetical protein
MPDETPNVMEHINEDGTFKDSFRETFTAFVGDEHKDSKLLENIPNVSTALKVMFDSKSKLGRKLDAHIPKPGKDATPEDMAKFRTAAFQVLGTPKKADEYEFPRVEGRGYDEDAEKAFREFFFERGYPKDMVPDLVGKFNEIQTARTEALEAAHKKALDEMTTKLDADWVGENRIKNNRLAYNAAMEFCPDEDMKKALKESKVYEDPGNHELWLKAGFNPGQRRFLYNVGLKMKSPEPPSDEGGPKGEKLPTGDFRGIMTHPTSLAAIEAQKKRQSNTNS